MFRGNFWLFTVMLPLCVTACSGEGAKAIGEVDTGELGVAEQQLAGTDRPAGALSIRGVDGEYQLWAFACGADHVMRRRVFLWTRGAVGVWGSWLTVAGSFPCAGPPSIARWVASEPLSDHSVWPFVEKTETLVAYYRGTNNHLIEAWYDSDGSKRATDLNAQRDDFYDIASNPTVVDAVDVPGMSQRISVAVKRVSDGQAFTLDFYQGDWHVRPVGGANGVVSVGDTITASYNQYSGSYLALQTGAGAYVVYSRKSWKDPYASYLGVRNQSFYGVMTFSGPEGRALVRSASNGINSTRWWALNSSAYGTFQLPGDNDSPQYPGGSLFSTSTGVSYESYARRGDGTLIWRNDLTDEIYASTHSGLSSAPVAVNGNYFGGSAIYTKLVSGRHELFWTSRVILAVNINSETDLAEAPLDYPGGVLAP